MGHSPIGHTSTVLSGHFTFFYPPSPSWCLYQRTKTNSHTRVMFFLDTGENSWNGERSVFYQGEPLPGLFFLSVTFFLAMVAKFAASPSDTLTFFPPALLFFPHSTYHRQPYDIFYLYLLPFSLDYRLLRERDLHILILFTDVFLEPRRMSGNGRLSLSIYICIYIDG